MQNRIKLRKNKAQGKRLQSFSEKCFNEKNFDTFTFVIILIIFEENIKEETSV